MQKSYKKSESKYGNYIVAFIDILGFKTNVKESIRDSNAFLKIDDALEEFSKLRLKENLAEK